jgi:hypothetical protein
MTQIALMAALLLQHAGMPFDQEHATHHFRLTAAGGVISVTVDDPVDAANLSMIRMHLKQIAIDFARGNFDAPFATHGEVPDGAEQMRTLRKDIRYRYVETPLGGEVRVSSSNPTAVEAVHAFLRYQIREHRTGDPLSVSR